MMAVRASHGLHTPLAPKSGSVGNSLRSDSRRFFIRFRHQRRVAIDGDHVKNNRHCKGKSNGNGNCNCNCNCNCRYAGTATSKATATVAARATACTSQGYRDSPS